MTGVVAPVAPAVDVESRIISVGDLALRTSESNLAVPIKAHVIGFDWSGTKAAEIEIRVRRNGVWENPVHVAGNPDEGPDDAGEEKTRTGPVWIGSNAERIRVRAETGTLRDVRMHAIRSNPDSGHGFLNVAEASVPQPGIITRQAWGADESWRSCGPDYADSVRNAFVHHTATATDYSEAEAFQFVRSIYHYHTKSNGWCDIGYNFLVDRFGRVFEGRFGGITKPVIGAHAGGFNTRSTGVALLGTHTSANASPAERNSLRALLAWKLDLHGVNPRSQIQVTSGGSTRYPEGTVVTLWTIAGHRDVSATECPGDAVYGDLSSLRSDVLRDIEEGWWEGLGGVLASAPDAASMSSGRLNIFVKGIDGALWEKRWDTAGWSSWQGLGGFITSDPGAVSWSEGSPEGSGALSRVDVFARGGDGALWFRTHSPAGWSEWASLGGVLDSAPDASSLGPGRIDVVALGTDGAVWMRRINGIEWTGWQSMGGRFSSAPSIVGSGSSLHIFGRGMDGALWTRSWDGSSWGVWNSLGGSITSAPDAASWGEGRVDVFARGGDGSLWSRSLTEGWSGWSRLAGEVSSDPSVVSWGAGRMDVFARRPDLSLGHRWYEGGSWNS